VYQIIFQQRYSIIIVSGFLELLSGRFLAKRKESQILTSVTLSFAGWRIWESPLIAFRVI